MAKNATSAPRTIELIGGRRISGVADASADELIGMVAAAQRARMSRAQLIALGVAPDAIVRRLRSGRLKRIHHGVYGLPNTAELPLAAETAALLACGMGAVLSHHSAITLWRLRPGAARPVHVTIPGERGCPAPDGVVVHRSTTLAPRDIGVHQWLPVTAPARAILDVAPALADRDVERLLDEALFALRIVTPAGIRAVLARSGGHPGRARLARVSRQHVRSTRTESPPEERLLALIRAAGLPEPELQANVLGYRLDFFWPKLRLALEVDAYATHGAPKRFEGDRRRDSRLMAEAGIIVLRLTPASIEHRPLETIATLGRAIGRRAGELRPG